MSIITEVEWTFAKAILQSFRETANETCLSMILWRNHYMPAIHNGCGPGEKVANGFTSIKGPELKQTQIHFGKGPKTVYSFYKKIIFVLSN